MKFYAYVLGHINPLIHLSPLRATDGHMISHGKEKTEVFNKIYHNIFTIDD